MKKNNTRRKDGRIAVQVYRGKVDGKRKYTTVYGDTQKEADGKADKIKEKRKKGLDLTGGIGTFEQWSKIYLARLETEVEYKSYKRNESRIKHLNNSFGNKLIDAVSMEDIQLVIIELSKYNPNTKKPAGKKTLESVKQLAHAIIDTAINARKLDFNCCTKDIIIPKNAPKEERKAITEEQQIWINETTHPMKRAAMIVLYSGVRRGELLALTWKDIDIKNKTIDINKKIVFENHRPVLKDGAKTPSGIRMIDIPQKLADYLSSEPKNTTLVFPDKNGNYMNENTFEDMWNKYLEALNVKYGKFVPALKEGEKAPEFVISRFTPHNLRHTYCTMLYFSGVDVLTAKEQMGHKKAQTTIDIYTHLDKKYKRKSMDKLDDYINASQVQVKNGSNA